MPANLTRSKKHLDPAVGVASIPAAKTKSSGIPVMSNKQPKAGGNGDGGLVVESVKSNKRSSRGTLEGKINQQQTPEGRQESEDHTAWKAKGAGSS